MKWHQNKIKRLLFNTGKLLINYLLLLNTGKKATFIEPRNFYFFIYFIFCALNNGSGTSLNHCLKRNVLICLSLSWRCKNNTKLYFLLTEWSKLLHSFSLLHNCPQLPPQRVTCQKDKLPFASHSNCCLNVYTFTTIV